MKRAFTHKGKDKAIPKPRKGNKNNGTVGRTDRNTPAHISRAKHSKTKDQKVPKSGTNGTRKQDGNTSPERGQDSDIRDGDINAINFGNFTVQEKTEEQKSRKRKYLAILNIKFLIKLGIEDKGRIKSFLKQEGLLISKDGDALFYKYWMIANNWIQEDKETSTWITDKIQNAQMHDFMKLYNMADRFLQETLDLIGYEYKKAEAWAEKDLKSKDRYPETIRTRIIKELVSTGIEAIRCKYDLMQSGFIRYQFKDYVDKIHQKLSGIEPLETDKDVGQIQVVNALPFSEKNSNIPSKETENQKDFKLANHLKGIEANLGKNLTTLEDYEK